VIPTRGKAGDLKRRAGERIGPADARFLLEHATGCTHAELIASPDRAFPDEVLRRFESLVTRRAAGEPLAYLVGTAWFCGLEFVVSPAVLIPRPETETLVERAAARARGIRRPRIADIGTGSGIVAIMLAKYFPDAEVTATDVSDAALDIACANAARHGVMPRFVRSDWFSALDGEGFDVIVSNPPYVAFGDPHLLENGLPFEPQLALTDGVAGAAGLLCIRKLIEGATRHLNPGASLLIEHGYDQAARVRALLAEAGFTEVRSTRDASGIERVTEGIRDQETEDRRQRTEDRRQKGIQ
jgi:release factor glutamine methyltransferase